MLAWVDWNLEASAANIDESRHSEESAQEYVLRLSAEKAGNSIPWAGSDDIIIAADTIVVLDEEMLGKPTDEREAFEMLSQLRARKHWVTTAIAVRSGGTEHVHQDICRTRVQMREYADEEIKQYIASGDPMDKAGAYAIQSTIFHPAVDFNGCFASVMGMPLCHLERTLLKFSIYELSGLAIICQNHLKFKCSIIDRVMAGEEIG